MTNERITKFVKTKESWYPNYPGDLVRVSLLPLMDNVTWRVVVWGNDDFGLERDFKSRLEATLVYDEISDWITQEELYCRQFLRG